MLCGNDLSSPEFNNFKVNCVQFVNDVHLEKLKGQMKLFKTMKLFNSTEKNECGLPAVCMDTKTKRVYYEIVLDKGPRLKERHSLLLPPASFEKSFS